MSKTAKLRVLVTGGAGFVGAHVLRILREAGCKEIAAFVRPGESASAVTFAGDVAEARDCARAITEFRPDAIIHLAAIAAPTKADADRKRAWSVNFDGVMNMAEALFEANAKAHFVFAGSSESYGATFSSAARPLTEFDPLRPLTVYAATKASADLYLGQLAASGFNAVRFRPFNHSGAGQSPEFVLPAFARQIARIERGLQENVLRVGNLDAARDFLDVRDVARAYVSAIGLEEACEGHVFNLASGAPRKIGDLLQAMLALSSASIKIETDPEKFRAAETPVAAGDATRAATILKWAPRIPIEETLKTVLDDWRARTAT